MPGHQSFARFLGLVAVAVSLLGCELATPTSTPGLATPSSSPVARGASALPSLTSAEPETSEPPADQTSAPTEPPKPSPSPDPVTVSAKVTIVETGSEGFAGDGSRMIVFDISRTFASARLATPDEWRSGVGGSVTVKLYRLRLRADGTDPRTVLLGWGGGGCDNLTRLEISANARQWHFFQGPWIGCDAVGVGWFEALTFDHPVAVSDLTIESTGWPTSTDGAASAIQMARVLSESSRTPAVIDVRDGTYEALYWGDLAERYPTLSAENMAILRETPSWLVALSGRYRTCDPAGAHCVSAEATEEFIFDVENAEFLTSRRR